MGAPAGGIAIAVGEDDLEGGYLMYWIIVVLLAGCALGWVHVRRRRKGVAKAA